jgi:SAM-dependent MidA family methyltransferase
MIPLERFMKEALYHPEYGYYSSRIHDVGPKGDFSTSATLDPHLGKAIANWILSKARQLGWKSIPVIEVGAGSGLLSKSVLRHLGWIGRLRTDYMICEVSPKLRARQEKTLRWQRVHWIKSPEEGLRRSKGRALIFSNELVDAFPCRVFQKSGNAWRESAVIIHADGSLSETTVASDLSEDWFRAFQHLPDLQRVERHDSYRAWLECWASLWEEGYLLTIDYGDSVNDLYNGRPGGSLRAYWKHERHTGRDLYARFGKQDLTADVNFSDLIGWGHSLGWGKTAFSTQREFVQLWNPAKGVMPPNERFLTPGDAGDAFKVLEQSPRHRPLN